MYIIIMAGGLGKRMKSDIPKVLHKVGEMPMLVKIIKTARELKPDKILVIVGKYKDMIEDTLKQYIDMKDIEFIIQEESLGTGHAIQCCKLYFEKMGNESLLILSGDTPLLTVETIKDFERGNNNKIMTTILEKPYGNGRIVRNMYGEFDKIVEERDSNEMECKIGEVNCGIYKFDSKILMENIMKLKNNNVQNEYYLTDIVKIIKDIGHKIDIYILSKDKQHELMNVNTKEQLDYINEHIL